MTIYASDLLVASESAVSTSSINLPVVGWHNVLAVGDITVPTLPSTSGQFEDVLWNPTTYDVYTSQDTIGSQTWSINLSNTSLNTINYVTVLGHNWYQIEGQHRLQKSLDGITWTDVIPWTNVDGFGPIMYLTEDINAPYLRVQVQASPAGTYNFQAAHIRAGIVTRLFTARLLDVTPPNINRKVEKAALTSTTGRYLGSWAKSVSFEYNIDQSYYSRNLINDKVLPFLAHCDQVETYGSNHEGPLGTFVYAWRPYTQPNDIVYCHPPQQIQQPRVHTASGLYRWGLVGQCEAWTNLY